MTLVWLMIGFVDAVMLLDRLMYFCIMVLYTCHIL